MIQPQVLLRLPCYDFTPITSFTFGGVLLAVRLPTSGPPGSHGAVSYTHLDVYKRQQVTYFPSGEAKFAALLPQLKAVSYTHLLDHLLAKESGNDRASKMVGHWNR